jgi:hypothetical protein
MGLLLDVVLDYIFLTSYHVTPKKLYVKVVSLGS